MSGKQPVYAPQPPVPLSRQARQYVRLLVARPIHADLAKFVIFAQGRTGSTLLVNLLSSHPQIHCDGEILERRVIAPVAWVESQRRRFPEQHYGFKVKPYQLTADQHVDPREWLQRMSDRGWRIFRLWRRNVLRHALSNMVAEHVGGFVFRTEAPPRPEGIVVDTEMLVAAMRARTDLIEQEQSALDGLPHITVCYEDDLRDAARHQPTLDRLSAELGLPSAPARTDVRRITEKDLREMIANYDEVARAVAATRWASMLDQ